MYLLFLFLLEKKKGRRETKMQKNQTFFSFNFQCRHRHTIIAFGRGERDDDVNDDDVLSKRRGRVTGLLSF